MIIAIVILVALLLVSLLTRKHAPADETIALDNLTLYSERYRLTGRPDRIVKIGEHYIPEEWKSAYKKHYGHCAQLAVYMLLVEEHYGIRPPYGILVLKSGQRIRVNNTAELRQDMLKAAQDIRALKAAAKAN